MIKMEDLKPVLELLIAEREDAADIIEQVTAMDLPVEVDRSEIDALNASWNERFKKQFFGEKAETINEELPQAPVEEETIVEEEEADGYDDVPTVDELITNISEEEEKEED